MGKSLAVDDLESFLKDSESVLEGFELLKYVDGDTTSLICLDFMELREQSSTEMCLRRSLVDLISFSNDWRSWIS